MKELIEELDDTDIHDDNLTVRSGAGGDAVNITDQVLMEKGMKLQCETCF